MFTYIWVCVSDTNVMQYIVCLSLPSKMGILCPLYGSIPVMHKCIDTVTASLDPGCKCTGPDSFIMILVSV